MFLPTFFSCFLKQKNLKQNTIRSAALFFPRCCEKLVGRGKTLVYLLNFLICLFHIHFSGFVFCSVSWFLFARFWSFFLLTSFTKKTRKATKYKKSRVQSSYRTYTRSVSSKKFIWPKPYTSASFTQAFKQHKIGNSQEALKQCFSTFCGSRPLLRVLYSQRPPSCFTFYANRNYHKKHFKNI